MRLLGHAHDKPHVAVGRASDQPDSNLGNIRSAPDTDCATSGQVARCQRGRRCRPNGHRDIGAWHYSTLGISDSCGDPD